MTAAAKNKKVTDLVRKVGDRQVEVDVDLTPEQIEEQHDTLVSLLEQIDEERIGDARRARADELQEKLFPDTPDKPDDEGDVEIPEAAPAGDDFPASDDAFGPQVS